jgi:hypothetical protein
MQRISSTICTCHQQLVISPLCSNYLPSCIVAVQAAVTHLYYCDPFVLLLRMLPFCTELQWPPFCQSTLVVFRWLVSLYEGVGLQLV